MSNAPPTPPPTTATELMDQTRNVEMQAAPPPIAAAAPAVATPPLPLPQQPVEDVYLAAFPQIASLAAEAHYDELIRVAELCELNCEGDRQVTRLLVAAPLALAYLITEDLTSTRFTLTRLPDNLAGSQLPQALIQLLAATQKRDYANVYGRAQALHALSGDHSVVDGKLGDVLRVMVEAFVAEFRRKTWILITKAYTSLPASLAATYLGRPPEALLEDASRAGWTYDSSTQIFTPSATAGSLHVKGTLSTPSTLTAFELVADAIAKLET